MTEQEYRESIEWFSGNDTGLSSRCLICFLTIKKIINYCYYPRNYWDLDECIKALEKLPFLRKDLVKAKEMSFEWDYIIDLWDFLSDLHKKEMYEQVDAILIGVEDLKKRRK